MKPVPNQLPASDPGPLRLACVGENPGPDECAVGYPFAGKSGWYLDGWLATAGVARSQVFVGNVAQVRPPGCHGTVKPNEFHLFDWNGGEIQEGIAALREDLARFRPNIVVALGNAALHLLRHGNVAPPKSQKLQLFQWSSHIGTWRGSLFLGARDFDAFRAADLRVQETQRGLFAAKTVPGTPSLAGDGFPLGKPTSQGMGSTPIGGTTCGEANGAGACIAGSSPERASLPTPFGDSLSAAKVNRDTPIAAVSAPFAHADGLPGMAPAPTSVMEHAKAPPGCGALSGERLDRHGSPLTPFKCLATYHPAATFREPSFVYPLVSDLKRAVAEARSAELMLPQRDIQWGLPVEQFEALCEVIRGRADEPIGFDIEGGLGGLQCASFATSPHHAFVVDLMDPTLDRPRLLTALFSVLEDASVPKVCWNAAYERAILQATHSVTLRNYEDGMLAWWERFSELPKGLDFVASILTREPYWAEGIGWDKRTGLPRVSGPRFWLYNGRDSCTTIEIWQHPIIKAVVESRAPVPFEL